MAIQPQPGTMVGRSIRTYRGLGQEVSVQGFGSFLLNWSELEEVLLDVESAINNRPLTYVEDDE